MAWRDAEGKPQLLVGYTSRQQMSWDMMDAMTEEDLRSFIGDNAEELDEITQGDRQAEIALSGLLMSLSNRMVNGERNRTRRA